MRHQFTDGEIVVYRGERAVVVTSFPAGVYHLRIDSGEIVLALIDQIQAADSATNAAAESRVPTDRSDPEQ